jgi:hypothetical protein
MRRLDAPGNPLSYPLASINGVAELRIGEWGLAEALGIDFSPSDRVSLDAPAAKRVAESLKLFQDASSGLPPVRWDDDPAQPSGRSVEARGVCSDRSSIQSHSKPECRCFRASADSGRPRALLPQSLERTPPTRQRARGSSFRLESSTLLRAPPHAAAPARSAVASVGIPSETLPPLIWTRRSSADAPNRGFPTTGPRPQTQASIHWQGRHQGINVAERDCLVLGQERELRAAEGSGS